MITVPDTVILPIRDPPKRPSIGLKRDIRSIQMSTRKMGRFASPLEDDGMISDLRSQFSVLILKKEIFRPIENNGLSIFNVLGCSATSY